MRGKENISTGIFCKQEGIKGLTVIKASFQNTVNLGRNQ